MKVCFPVKEDSGIESEVYGHFGSAPSFVVVDADSGSIASITNSDKHHEHGSCSPVKAIGWHEVDCVVVGGIGAGALTKLGMAGIPVYRAGAATIRENVDLLKSGKLKQFDASHVCSGHGQRGGCAH